MGSKAEEGSGGLGFHSVEFKVRAELTCAHGSSEATGEGAGPGGRDRSPSPRLNSPACMRHELHVG